MGGFLGPVTLAGPRWNYPLGFHHAARITGQRLALAGDAAHGIHPIAGQGLNLGFRDAAALAEVLVEGARLGLDLGDAQLLDRYERWRSLDTFMVAMATDSLTRLYGVPGRAASALRRFGMGAVQRIGPLKARLMAEARGETGELPLLLRGLDHLDLFFDIQLGSLVSRGRRGPSGTCRTRLRECASAPRSRRPRPAARPHNGSRKRPAADNRIS